MKTYNSYLTTRSLSDIYNLIYYKLYQNSKGWINQEKDGKKLTSFLLLLNEIYGISSIGRNFISEYLFYQFCYWYDKKTRYSMKLDWVIGKKAVTRYQNASNENLYVCIQRMAELGVTSETIRELILREGKKEVTIQNTNPTTETFKSKIPQTARLAYCKIEGLAYNSYSKVCLTCLSGSICKKLL